MRGIVSSRVVPYVLVTAHGGLTRIRNGNRFSKERV